MLTETISNRKFGVATNRGARPRSTWSSPRSRSSATTSTVGHRHPVRGDRQGRVDRRRPAAGARMMSAGQRPGLLRRAAAGRAPRPTVAASSPPTQTPGFGSARSCRASIRSRPTARSASCSSRPAGTRSARALHFIVEAPGHRPLTTPHLRGRSEYIESDTVFAVKKSLVADFEEVHRRSSGEAVERRQDPVPPRRLEIIMQPGS